MGKDLFDEGSDIQSNWMRFDNVGDSIIGTLREIFQKPGVGVYKEQQVYVLENVILNGVEQPASQTYNVGFACDIDPATKKRSKDFIHSRLEKLPIGTHIGLKFTEIIPAKTKGLNDTKSIKPVRFEKCLHSNPITSKSIADSVFNDPSDMLL